MQRSLTGIGAGSELRPSLVWRWSRLVIPQVLALYTILATYLHIDRLSNWIGRR